MAVIFILPEEWKDAQNIESFRNWRSWMPYMEAKEYVYVNNEPRSFAARFCECFDNKDERH